jgi:hypothetical protein
MNRDTYDMLARLERLGISRDDAASLRRISMTLHRWHEMECGDSDSYKSTCVTRGHKANGAFEYDDAGKPYMETHYHSERGAKYYPIPDRERGALKRLAAIMARYPTLKPYVQGDPRGASLYILRPGDVPEGGDPDSYYSRGIAVYK